jgi:molybdate transport system substrate-binding protein
MIRLLLLTVAATIGASAGAAEIKLLTGSALDAPLRVLNPQFERTSGHRVIMDSDGAIGAMAKRVAGGESADVLIVAPAQLAVLERQGKVQPGTTREVARTGVGIFVRKGAPKPDLSTVDAFKETLRRAKSIGYNDPAAGAPVSVYLIDLFQRLGMAAQLAPKTVVFKDRRERFAAVARGDVEIGFNQVAEIVTVPDIDLVGPLPAAIQYYTIFSAGVVAASRSRDAAQAFVEFISSPPAAAVMRAKGFE